MKEIFSTQKGSGMLHPIQHPAPSDYSLSSSGRQVVVLSR